MISARPAAFETPILQPMLDNEGIGEGLKLKVLVLHLAHSDDVGKVAHFLRSDRVTCIAETIFVVGLDLTASREACIRRPALDSEIQLLRQLVPFAALTIAMTRVSARKPISTHPSTTPAIAIPRPRIGVEDFFICDSAT